MITKLKNITRHLMRYTLITTSVTGGLLVMSTTIFAGKIDQEIEAIFSDGGQETSEVITENDLRDLPGPVQKWLKVAGVIGTKKAISVRLRQEGFFRRSPDSDWMPYTAEQYYTTDVPAFIWRAKIKASPVMRLLVRDKYENGRGNMLIKLWSMIPVGNATGPELDQGTLLRYLNETMWFPSVVLNEYITWEAVNDSAAKATMEYEGVKASAVFYFNNRGMVENMTADRYMEKDGEFEMHQWSTPISGYKEFHGITIPAEGEGVWDLPSGDFSYIRLEIMDIEYNVPEQY